MFELVVQVEHQVGVGARRACREEAGCRPTMKNGVPPKGEREVGVGAINRDLGAPRLLVFGV